MPSGNYAVAATAAEGSSRLVRTTNRTATGFTLQTVASTDGTFTDSKFSAVVHATNAVLPQAFTEQEIQQVVDLAQRGDTNPGVSAWGSVSDTGALQGGLNIQSVTRASTGQYDVVFATPMPNADYSVVCVHSADSVITLGVNSKTATGFRVASRGN